MKMQPAKLLLTIFAAWGALSAASASASITVLNFDLNVYWTNNTIAGIVDGTKGSIRVAVNSPLNVAQPTYLTNPSDFDIKIKIGQFNLTMAQSITDLLYPVPIVVLWNGHIDALGYFAVGAPVNNSNQNASLYSFTLEDRSALGRFIISTKSGGAFEQRAFANASLVSVETVPEPGAWALMVIGFSLLGATIRRNRPTSDEMRKTPLQCIENCLYGLDDCVILQSA